MLAMVRLATADTGFGILCNEASVGHSTERFLCFGMFRCHWAGSSVANREPIPGAFLLWTLAHAREQVLVQAGNWAAWPCPQSQM